MKRKIGWIMLAALVVVLAAGGTMLAKTTITWWINPWRIAPPGMDPSVAPTGEDFPQWASEEFMRLNPDVEVVYEVVTNAGYEEKVSAAILARRTPDLMKILSSARNGRYGDCWSPLMISWRRKMWKTGMDYALEGGMIDGKHMSFLE